MAAPAIKLLMAAGGASAAPFDPVTSVGWAHVYWAEGSEFQALGLADGAAVSAWPDEAGTDDLARASATLQPIYRASGTGLSLPCIDFDGSNDSFESENWSAGTMTKPNTVVVLGYIDTTGNQYIVDGIAVGSRRIIGLDNTGPDWGHYAGAWALEAGTPAAGKFAMRSKIVTGTSDVLTRNGSTVATGSAGDHDYTGIHVGSAHDNTLPFNGRLYWVGVYAGDATADPEWADFVTWAAGKGFTLS